MSLLKKSEIPTVFDELYRGLKPSKVSALYPLLSITKLLMMGILLVALQCLPTTAKLVMMGFIQVCHLAYIAIFRPYRHIRDNIIDLVNEVFMLIVLVYCGNSPNRRVLGRKY